MTVTSKVHVTVTFKVTLKVTVNFKVTELICSKGCKKQGEVVDLY